MAQTRKVSIVSAKKVAGSQKLLATAVYDGLEILLVSALNMGVRLRVLSCLSLSKSCHWHRAEKIHQYCLGMLDEYERGANTHLVMRPLSFLFKPLTS